MIIYISLKDDLEIFNTFLHEYINNINNMKNE